MNMTTFVEFASCWRSRETLTATAGHPTALPLARGVIVRAKVSALILFAAGFAAALNVLPAMIHPVSALSRLLRHPGTPSRR